ncbi:MAG: ABC transporter substrate-binding protein [Methylobacteriaceae bacterium]|nr:ABC transporter substrate-binding protein [Methylobacteriaceae bacterium]
MEPDGKISLLRHGQSEPDEAGDEGEDLTQPGRGVRAQNRRQKLFFLLGTIFLTILIAGGVRYYRHAARPIQIAAGPAGSLEYRFAEKFAELVKTNATDVRLSIIADESSAAATSRFGRGDADLGFVRTDQKVPGSARALALIEHFAFLLIVPKGSKVANLGDLRGKKVAFVTSEGGAEALFRSILTASQVEPDRITLQPMPGDTAIDSLFGRDQFQAAIVFASLSALAETKRFERQTKIEVKAIEGSKALERKVAGTTSETIQAGLLSTNPKIPDDDLETVGVQEFITVRRRLSSTIVAELAGILLENKTALGIDNSFATRIEPPDTDKDAFIVAHQGVSDYTDNEVKSFLDRYSDLFYIGTSVLGILGSLSAAIYTAVTRVKPLEPAQYADQVLEINDRVATATTSLDLDEAERELDIVLRQVLIGLKHGNVSTRGLDGFRLAYEHAHTAIAARRQRIAERPVISRVSEA